jgi:Domain of unknown function (DUF4143)
LAVLRVQLTWAATDVSLYHWQDRSGAEVDIVIEAADGRVTAIEVKTGQTAKPEWFRWLAQMRDTLGETSPPASRFTRATRPCPSETGSSQRRSQRYGNREHPTTGTTDHGIVGKSGLVLYLCETLAAWPRRAREPPFCTAVG